MENTATATNNNHIRQIEVCELLDDRYFFIPSYQRGYRWGKKQIYDLCNDLLEYALKKKNNGSFYSLQPLIVRKSRHIINGVERDTYEVIDGQQRLTSIFILYRFLAKESNYSSIKEICDDYSKSGLYHIYYQTRPDDYKSLEKSGFEELTADDIKDIDIAHISNAYKFMKQWLTNEPENDNECAKATFALFSNKEQFQPKRVKEKLLGLLNTSGRNNSNGSLQFIWYELNAEKDTIREFLSENKGKIKLTDTEKIKALFMQRSNFGETIKDLKQISIAKDWELIENTLHRNDFWSFISNDPQLEDGRINIIFKFIYDKEGHTAVEDDDYLFRFYYQKFAQIRKSDSIDNVSISVDNLWNDVMDCYRMLQNWYYNPKVYNLVGLLIKHGHSIKQISDIYNDASVVSNEDFIRALNKEIRREIIDGIEIRKEQAELGIEKDEEYIDLFFPKDKPMMHDLFRFLNVMEINKTIDKALKEIDIDEGEKKKSDLKRSARDVMSHIYRFPYEALDVFGWDIEHIDSATTNSLTEPKEQKVWLDEAHKAIEKILEGDIAYQHWLEEYRKYENQNKEKANAALKEMVTRVHAITGEEESDFCKNWIGNLTLLDSGTNRSYKNKIFAWKGDIIRERIKAGVFVPICTQNIFYKSYKGCGEHKWKWSKEDKKAYHKYMLQEIKSFKERYSE